MTNFKAFINRKSVAILLIALILMGFAPLPALAAGVVRVGDYDFDAATGTIEKYYGAGGAVEIPAQIGGVPVTAIGHFAFAYSQSLTSLSLPKSVTSIHELAFESCSNLEAVSVDEASTAYKSVNGVLFSFDQKALIKYPSKKSGTFYEIPSGVESLGAVAFELCQNLTGISIPGSVTSIRQSAFLYCTNLKSVNIPDSVTSIGEQAFWGCYDLKGVNIPGNVKSIDDNAFGYCIRLEYISVDKASTVYKSINGVLYSFDGKTLIQYPPNKSEVYYEIPSGVESLGNRAFYYCQNLTGIGIPASVTNIGEGAFEYCQSLKSAIVPPGIKSIRRSTFRHCKALVSVSLPDSVTSIELAAFAFCESLRDITFPAGLNNLDEYAFVECKGFKNITVPKGMSIQMSLSAGK